MKFVSIFIISIFLITILSVNGCLAGTRVIKGTVFTPEGKPASGILVTANHSKEKFYTSFDGTYVIKIDSKTTYLKFKFADREERLDIAGNDSKVVNFGKKAELPLSPQTNKSK